MNDVVERVARPTLLAQPEWCPGGYSLDLYCKYENSDHAWDEFPHSPGPCQTYGQAAAIARGWGWILHRDRTATCPKCARALGLGKFSAAHADASPDIGKEGIGNDG